MMSIYIRCRMAGYAMLVADLTPLCTVSYNCRRFNALKKSYVETLLTKANVIFLQERWLSDEQVHCLDDID
jgi:hypothetical protein